MKCRDVELLITLYACGELEGAEQAAVEGHLEACAACRESLARERRLLEVMTAGGQEEPSAVLLTGCRNQLSDALDELGEAKSGWRRWVAAVRPARLFLLHPAWGAAFFLVLGIVAGNVVPRWFNHPVDAPLDPASNAQMVIQPSPIFARDLQDVSLTGINWLPGPDESSPNIELRFEREQREVNLPGAALHVQREEPEVVRVTMDDPHVKRILAYVVENNQRFNSGLRLDSVELLKTRSNDAEVREALCYAARRDGNPAVRLKALEALQGLGQDEKVRQILIEALLHDQNPGVRIEAVNALRALAEAAGPERAAQYPQLMDVLRDRMQRDPNTYVRMQSAAVMRQLGPRVTY